MNSSDYRSLLPGEVQDLIANGCRCNNWQRVFVKEKFNPGSFRNVEFSGDVYIGIQEKEFNLPGGIPKHAGIYNAYIHNSIIGDNVYISQVKNYIANYHLHQDVIIENIDSLYVEGKSSFGNGVRVAVLNEAGGREIAIYNELSAHTAYLLVFYRHRPLLIDKVLGMIDDYARERTSNMGNVMEGAHLSNCRAIINVNIGPWASVEGIHRLNNGTINSCKEDPAYVGPGVIADNFIFSSGSVVSESSVISKAFVGQGTVIGKQYSAENSVFFANCQGFHGEACSIFGGPYTVSHHKSTLLIAGYYSFLNAGSGSNQSNHMYKLGPIHQGIVERGSKSTSDSYLLWPAKIGAFSLVMGRHYRNPDTSDLPSSYLIENTDESFLAPGVNLRSIGTIRDARKWAKRDRRKSLKQLDHIVFNLLSPYSIQKIIRGIEILERLKDTSGPTSDYYMYNSVKITASALERGISLYKLGLVKFLGNGLVKKLEVNNFEDAEAMRSALKANGTVGDGEWVDIAGLLAPQEVVEEFLMQVEKGPLNNLDEINEKFAGCKHDYFIYAWNWIVPRLKRHAGLDISLATPKEISSFVEEWKKAVVTLDQMMYEDAKKEFTIKAQIGFGIDGKADVREMDFEKVRGEFSTHPAITDILEHIKKKSKLAEVVLDKLARLG